MPGIILDELEGRVALHLEENLIAFRFRILPTALR